MSYMLSLQEKYTVHLYINHKLKNLALKDKNYKYYIEYLENRKSLIIYKKAPKSIVKKIFYKIIARLKCISYNDYLYYKSFRAFDYTHVHSVLKCVYQNCELKDSMNLSFEHIYEVTSPDIVKMLAYNSQILMKIDKISCVSENVYKLMSNLLADIRSDVKILKPNSAFYLPTEAYEYSLKDKEKIVLFAHRLINRKNPTKYLEAVELLSKEYSDWKFLIYGAGEMRQEIIEMVERIGKNVEYGYTTEISELQKRSSIFVSIIEPDNYPSQSVLEAMYFGNAVVLSDTGCSKKMFYYNNGVVIQSIDKISIYKGIKDIIDSNRIYDMQKKSVELVRKKYTTKKYLDYLESMYS